MKKKSNASLNSIVIAISALITIFYPLATTVKAERPDVVWMRGGTTFGVVSMDYSPDGQLFATVEQGFYHVKIWRNSDGLLIRTIKFDNLPNSGANEVVKFTPDGQNILVKCIEGSRYHIKLVRISDGLILRTFGDEAYINVFAVMSDETLAVGVGTMPNSSATNTVKFYNFSTGSFIRSLTNITYVNNMGATVSWLPINGVLGFSANGRILVSASNPPTGEGAVIDGNGRLIGYKTSIGFSRSTPDGSVFFSNSNPTRIFRLAELCYPQQSCISQGTSIPSNGNASFSPNGQIIAASQSSSLPNLLSFYQTSNGALIYSTPVISPSESIFSPDGQAIAIDSRIESPNSDSSVKFIRVSDGAVLRRLESFYKKFSNVIFSPNGQTIATLSSNFPESVSLEPIIKIWNASDGTLIRSIPTGQNSQSITNENQLAVYSPDGQFIFNGTPQNGIQMWRVSDGSLVRTIPVVGTIGLAVSPDGQIIASIPRSIAPSPYSISLYRTSDGSLIRTISPPAITLLDGTVVPTSTVAMAFTPDGSTLAMTHPFVYAPQGVIRGYIRLYNVATGTGSQLIQTQISRPQSIAISPDGQTFAVAGIGICNGCSVYPTTGLAELRRVSDSSLIRSFPEHSGRDYVVKFTLDGQKIVTGGAESAIRFWNIDGTLAKVYDQEVTADAGTSTGVNVPAIAFSPDGSRFAYSRRDTTLVVANNPFNQTSGRAPFDFDADGKSDVSVFRPSNTVWYVSKSSDNGVLTAQWGIATDKMVPADYNGDGKTDYAVFRDGFWYILLNGSGFEGAQWGSVGDIPFPADFDADGKADLAVFRNGTWFVRKSSGGTITQNWGSAGDIPVVADYDADSKADFAVYRNGIWYVLKSTGGDTAVQWGIAGDKTVQADYNGDGKADYAVFRNGFWYILLNGGGFIGAQWGATGDLASPADYDGDGKTDLAVFRNGVWYIQRTTAGVQVVNFGSAGDKPVPNAFVP